MFFTRSTDPRSHRGRTARRGLTALHPEYETLWSLEAESMRSTPTVRRGTSQCSSARKVAGNIARRCVDAASRGLFAPGEDWFGRLVFLFLLLFAVALPAAGRKKDKVDYGEGLIVSIPLPEREVEQVVEDVVQNGVIRGTKEYNRDEFVAGAIAATSSQVFPPWREGGKVFYKVREHALDPRNFKDSSDSGTLVVRYIVQAQGEKNAVLRINALFKEDFRHMVHQSDGSVEAAEYQDIREHVEAIKLMKQQNAEALNERRERLEKKQTSSSQVEAGPWPVPQSEQPEEAAPVESHQDAAPSGTTQVASQNAPDQAQPIQNQPGQDQPAQGQPNQVQPAQSLPSQSTPGVTSSGQSLEEHVRDLQRQLERLVKEPGAPLKSAPFHTATTLQSLPTGTEVLIVISTPYWYGVETHDGQHGWMMRDDLVQK